MENNAFPRVLVETWLELSNNSRYPDAQKTANCNLVLSFDDINQAKVYAEIENINLNKVAR